MRVLFVCTGNICRSPTAERLAASYALRQDVAAFQASSAGVRAVRGHPIHPEAARVLQRLGGSSAGFTARQLTPKLALAADLIVAMETEHRDAVLGMAPRQLGRTFLLTEVARLVHDFNARSLRDLVELRPQLAGRGSSEIADPIGQEAEVFWRVGNHISKLIPAVVELGR